MSADIPPSHTVHGLQGNDNLRQAAAEGRESGLTALYAGCVCPPRSGHRLDHAGDFPSSMSRVGRGLLGRSGVRCNRIPTVS